MTVHEAWKDLIPRLERDLLARDRSLDEANLDEAAWASAERLLRIYARALRGSASILSVEDVNDVVQDVIVKLQSRQTMRRLRVAGSPAGYVAVMVRNAMTDLVRRRAREIALVHPIDETTPARTSDQTETQESEAMLRMKAVLRLLKPEDRYLLRLRFWKNMTINEISETLGISYSAAAVRLFRIMSELRNALGV